jgi:hypothetical protein
VPLPRIAFLGTGVMGAHMARRLAEAGFSVTAWNRSVAKARPLEAYGVTGAAHAAQALGTADVAIVMQSTGAVIDDVLFQRCPGHGAGRGIQAGRQPRRHEHHSGREGGAAREALIRAGAYRPVAPPSDGTAKRLPASAGRPWSMPRRLRMEFERAIAPLPDR